MTVVTPFHSIDEVHAEPYQPLSIPPNWGRVHAATGGPKFSPVSTQSPRESFDLPNSNMKHYKKMKLDGPLKEQCLRIAVTLGPFKSKVYTLQLLLGAL